MMRTVLTGLLTVAMTLGFVACGDDSDSGSGDGDTGGTTVTFSQVQSLTATSCARSGCHDGANATLRNLTTEAGFTQNSGSFTLTNLKDRINRSSSTAGVMPVSGNWNGLSTTNQDLVKAYINGL